MCQQPPSAVSSPAVSGWAARVILTPACRRRHRRRRYTTCVEPQALEFLPVLRLPLLRGEEHDCPYLPDRTAAELFALPLGVDSGTYRRLMDLGFRRAGQVFYRPSCPGCRECAPIRVPVERFTPSRSQRRVLRRNHDLRVQIGPPVEDDRRYELYRRYQAWQHEGRMIEEREEFAAFFCGSPIDTIEMSYWLGERLVGVGIVDVCPGALSSVYFYSEPDFARRSLGVFSALCEMEECRRRGLAYWYVGFYIRDCRKMSYKARFRPHELLGPDGRWRQPS